MATITVESWENAQSPPIIVPQRNHDDPGGRHNRRISRHQQVFDGLAARGKTSVDWFFGFKLHLVVSECGDLLNLTLTPGNVDDRKPVPNLLKELLGKVFADQGYVSLASAQQLFEQ